MAGVEGASQPTLPRTSSSVAAMAAAERVTAAERIAKQVRQQERALAALSLSDDEIKVSPDKAGENCWTAYRPFRCPCPAPAVARRPCHKRRTRVLAAALFPTKAPVHP